MERELIDWTVCIETRRSLGSNFVRILGYFREDGTESIRKIEEAMRASDPVAMVDAAHSLKGEALQFGALQLSESAETIEFTARACVERHDTPDDLLPLVVALRPMFEETLSLLEMGASPLIQREPERPHRRFG